jgi:hypothetical protein
MTSYLREGWFERRSGKGAKGLRTEVIDGSMDAAGILLRAGVDGATVLRLALRTRALMAIADPRMLGVPKFTDRERALVMNGLARHIDAVPELYAFVADCVERVDNLIDLMAFYLHLTHVARMIELLAVAQRMVVPNLQTMAAPKADAKVKAKPRARPKAKSPAKKSAKTVKKKIAKPKAAKKKTKASRRKGR